MPAKQASKQVLTHTPGEGLTQAGAGLEGPAAGDVADFVAAAAEDEHGQPVALDKLEAIRVAADADVEHAQLVARQRVRACVTDTLVQDVLKAKTLTRSMKDGPLLQLKIKQSTLRATCIASSIQGRNKLSS